VGNLVDNFRNKGGQTHCRTRGKGCSDRRTTNEFVQPVAQQDQMRHRVMVLSGALLRVMPMNQLLKGEKKHETEGHPSVRGAARSQSLLHGGQHVEKRAANK